MSMVHRGWATEGRRVLMRVVTILITRCKAAGQAGSLKGSSSQQNSGLRRANSKHGVFQQPLANARIGNELHTPVESVRKPVQAISAAIHQSAGGRKIVASQRLADAIFAIGKKL